MVSNILSITLLLLSISILGGSSNAYTDSEDTVYYFDVNSDYLDEALDRYFLTIIIIIIIQNNHNNQILI
jgi:hypothetical protein